MNYKFMLICAIITQADCQCDGYFQCLGDFLQNVLSDKNNSSFNIKYNYSEVDFDAIKEENNKSNNTIVYHDLSELGKSFNQALVDITQFIKDGLSGMLNFDKEVNVHKDLNETEIHVRAFGLSKINRSNESDSELGFPDTLVNNFTEFNDEFEALKIEIEKNLQTELEAFISRITENDTLDWDDVATTLSDKVEARIKDELGEVTIDFPNQREINITDIVNNRDYENLANDPLKVSIDIDNNSEYAKDDKKTINNIDKEEDRIIEAKDELNKLIRNSIVSTPTPFTLTTQNVINITVNNELNHSKLEEIDTKPKTQTREPVNYKKTDNIKLNEITKDNEDVSYYDIQDDNSTDYPIIDYVDLYKDTTNENIEYKPTETSVQDKTDLDNVIENADLPNYLDKNTYVNDTSSPAYIFSSVATVFIKNASNNQFDYYCDGVLLTETLVITAGRCLTQLNTTASPGEVLVFLGKRSLQSSGEGEEIHKVSRLTLHQNFTSSPEETKNDLAALELESSAVLNDRIQTACIIGDGESSEAITTAWDANLSIIKFEETNKSCEKNEIENTFCATFGNAVALCPSYGGAYAVKSSGGWCVRGLRTADPSSKGYCLEKTVAFTDLTKYSNWINDVLNKKVF